VEVWKSDFSHGTSITSQPSTYFLLLPCAIFPLRGGEKLQKRWNSWFMKEWNKRKAIPELNCEVKRCEIWALSFIFYFNYHTLVFSIQILSQEASLCNSQKQNYCIIIILLETRLLFQTSKKKTKKKNTSLMWTFHIVSFWCAWTNRRIILRSIFKNVISNKHFLFYSFFERTSLYSLSL